MIYGYARVSSKTQLHANSLEEQNALELLKTCSYKEVAEATGISKSTLWRAKKRI